MDYCLRESLDSISFLDQTKYRQCVGIDRECRLEHLSMDLFEVFEEYGIEIENTKMPHIQKQIRPYPFNLPALQDRKDFYYPDTAKLVLEKDSIIIENSGYKY